MNATHDDQSDEPRQPGLTRNADEDVASPGLTRNKADGMTPGEILREGRLAHDYSIDDLCAQTKLSAHTVEALEDNDFQSLSQPVFARGYYRQCAKVLDLDVERLMAAYTAIAGETPRPRIDRDAAAGGVIPQDVTPGGGFPLRGLLLVVIAIVVVIGAVIYVLPSSSVPDAVTDNGVRNTSGDQGGDSGDTFEFNSSNDDEESEAGADRESRTPAADRAGDASAPDVAGGNEGQARTGRQPGGRNVNQSLGITPPDRNRGAGNPAGDEQSSSPAVPPNHLVLTFSKRSDRKSVV